MTIIDARSLEDGFELQTTICIIGGGVAGITLATELAGCSTEVCLIESGGTAPDELMQSLHDVESTGYPIRQNYMSRARYYGGTSNLWAGRNMTLGELDLEARSWVPDSGWPIGYGELWRHYPRAARVLGLPSMEILTPSSVERRLTAGERSLLANEALSATVSVWGQSAMRFASRYGGRLRRASNVRVVLNAPVTAIGLDRSGKTVTGITVRTLTGRTLHVRARIFVLASGGLENARLLLASRDVQPQGIGNGHDLVGRFYMDHPRSVFGKVHLEPNCSLSLLRGQTLRDGKLQGGIGLSAKVQRTERLLNHYVTFESQTSGYTQARYQSFVQAAKIVLRRGYAGSRWDFAKANLGQMPNMIYLLSPKELMPHALYRAYVAAREAIPRKPTAKTYVVVYFCEQPPDRHSRVVLTEAQDNLGMKRLELRWRIGPEVTQSLMRMQEILAEQLRASGMGRLEPGSGEPEFTDASHHIGTTRMSADPRQGVVDPDCRVHGIDNLYIAGSSVFPAAGHANPTLSIVALTLRLADHLQTAQPTAA